MLLSFFQPYNTGCASGAELDFQSGQQLNPPVAGSADLNPTLVQGQ
jgi:hypothetical protein